MKGKYKIVVRNKRICYEFELKRNITVLRGDSATGKTTMIEMIQEFDENGIDSGVVLNCEKRCAVLNGKTWEIQLEEMKDCIVFIDEGNSFTSSRKFADVIKRTDNYYVIVTRESLPTLPYSVEEIYGIRNSGKYGSLKTVYNHFFHLYGMHDYEKINFPEVIITEDSNAGYEFFQEICRKEEKECLSSAGKSNLFSTVLGCGKKKRLVIADGAAFGSEIEKLLKLAEADKSIQLYLPESFEWMILKSGVVEDRELVNILEAPYNYIDSSEE